MANSDSDHIVFKTNENFKWQKLKRDWFSKRKWRVKQITMKDQANENFKLSLATLHTRDYRLCIIWVRFSYSSCDKWESCPLCRTRIYKHCAGCWEVFKGTVPRYLSQICHLIKIALNMSLNPFCKKLNFWGDKWSFSLENFYSKWAEYRALGQNIGH